MRKKLRITPMKIYHYEDKRLKQKDPKSLNRHMHSLGCELNAVKILNSEITKIDTGEHRLDINVLEADGTITIIEGQYGDPPEGAISKEILYGAKVNHEIDNIKESLKKINSKILPNGRIRKIMVITRPTEKLKDIIRSLNKEDEISRIEVYSPYSINGDEKLEEIINKVKHKQELTEDDYEFLDYAIHTNFKITPHEMLKKVSWIIENIKLTNEEREYYIRVHQQDALRYVSKKHLDETLEAICVSIDFIEQVNKDIANEREKEIIQAMEKEGASKQFIENVLKRAGKI